MSEDPAQQDPSGPSTTWRRPGEEPAAVRARVPCLTLCAHAEVARIGERAVLRGLLVRNPVAVSRVDLAFAQPGASGAGTPLLDPYLSRTKLHLRGGGKQALTLAYERDDVRVDGEPLASERTLGDDELANGVVIELAERVVLLLHLIEGGEPTDGEQLPGASDGIEAVRREVARVAPLEVPVLIRGETGSGKERVAQALHAQSARAGKPLVSVNMAAVSTSTAASVLFGHARGAFTGAVARHEGLFEQAHGGTLFLDEIGEAPDEVQPMLLRVLESGRITPLGDQRERQVDVRVLTATDAELESEVAAGRFRSALLHRLAGYEVWLPPLRARRDDIPRLLVRFLREELSALGEAHRLQGAVTEADPYLPTALVARLLRHPLPGNVRQLRNLVRRLALSSTGQARLVIDAAAERLLDHERVPSQLPPATGAPSGPQAARKPTDISDLELLSALESSGWSPRRAARALGISVSSVHDLMRRCPSVRKAKDIEDQELRDALGAAAGDVEQAAATLRVSERALRITLRERGLLPDA